MNENVNELQNSRPKFSSDFHIDMNREFVYWNYPKLRRENNPDMGVDSAQDVVFSPVDIDTLCYILMRGGTYLILFGGIWSHATQSVIDKINDAARKHGVDTVYLFDFSADGTDRANIRQDIRAHENYIGEDKTEANPFAVYNYIYGEIVTRHLTNLNDWVEEKIGSGKDITYLNLYQDAVTVPGLTEPFLFLYNRDNMLDHSGAGRQGERCPIVWAAELGEADEDTGALLEEKIFRHINENECVLTPYGYADYMREAFAQNHRGHGFKTEDAFRADEQIQLCKVPYQVFRWILQQEGTFVMLLAGPWCANSQAAVTTINDYAVANGNRVYMADTRLDGKQPFDFWQYPRLNELTLSCPAMRKYYLELWEQYLPGAQIPCTINHALPYERNLTIEETDENGVEHRALRVGIPFLFAYDKDHFGNYNRRLPLLASRPECKLELINDSEKYIYYEPNYKEYKAGVFRVFASYKERVGEEIKEIAIDRTAPIVPAQRPPHVENVAYHKHHDWYRDEPLSEAKNAGWQKNVARREAQEDEQDNAGPVYSSDLEFDMTKEFVYQNYPGLQSADDSIYGVDRAEDVVFMPLDLDELCYLLMHEGTFMILFGGVWSGATQSVMGHINACARKHGVDTVYLFDFSADGTEYGNIKRDMREQADYNGPDKKESNDFAVYNYLYGEIVTRYLTNLGDWTNEKTGSGRNITYINLYQDEVTVSNVTEPFLFLYNKNNVVNYSGRESDGNTYPIMYGLEMDRADAATDALLEERIFSHVGGKGCEITPYSYGDYIREAFAMNTRGHSFKTEDAFNATEPINVIKVNFQVFRWMLEQKGSFVFELGGPWCAYTQGSVATVNDYAVANHSHVYMSDIRLDSKHAIDFWHYPRRNELTMTCPPMVKYDIDLWEKKLPAAPIMCSIDPNKPYKSSLTVDYTDPEGKEHHVLRVGVPYIFSYNKDHRDERGERAPLLAARHDSGELINCSEEFIYARPLYTEFKASVYRVFYYCLKTMGREAKEITVDRTAPIIKGKPVPHKEPTTYTKYTLCYCPEDGKFHIGIGCTGKDGKFEGEITGQIADIRGYEGKGNHLRLRNFNVSSSADIAVYIPGGTVVEIGFSNSVQVENTHESSFVSPLCISGDVILEGNDDAVLEVRAKTKDAASEYEIRTGTDDMKIRNGRIHVKMGV